jgi:hypothetical protein
MLSRRNAFIGWVLLRLLRRRFRRNAAGAVEADDATAGDVIAKGGRGRLRKLFRLLVTGAGLAGAVWFKKRRSGSGDNLA